MHQNQKNEECPFEIFTLADDYGDEAEHVILDKFDFEFENGNSEYWVTAPKDIYLDSDEVFIFRLTTRHGEPFLDDDLSVKELDLVLAFYEKRCQELIEKYGDDYGDYGDYEVEIEEFE